MNLQVTPEKAQLSTQLSEEDSRAHQNPAQAEVSSTAAQTCGGSIWWCTRQFNLPAATRCVKCTSMARNMQREKKTLFCSQHHTSMI